MARLFVIYCIATRHAFSLVFTGQRILARDDYEKLGFSERVVAVIAMATVVILAAAVLLPLLPAILIGRMLKRAG